MSEQQEYSEELFQQVFPTRQENGEWVCQFDGANEVRTTGQTGAEALKKMILVLDNCANVNTHNLARLMSQLKKAQAVLAEHQKLVAIAQAGAARGLVSDKAVLLVAKLADALEGGQNGK